MASAALEELTALLGDKEATRLYNAIVGEYTAHVRKHANAVKRDTPAKGTEVDTLIAVLDRVEADKSIGLTAAVGDLGKEP